MACSSCMATKLHPAERNRLCARAHGTVAPRAATAGRTTTAPRAAPVVVPVRPNPVELAGRGQEAYHALTMLDVDDQVRRSAVRAVKSAAAVLGIDPPEVIWVAARGEPGWHKANDAGRVPIVAGAGIDGFFQPQHPRVIHLRAAITSPRHAAYVAAHEVAHAWQHRAGVPLERATGDERERLEQEANTVADRVMAKLDDGGLW